MGRATATRARRRGCRPASARGSWQATPLPGPEVDAYGCGDSFAAALTYGLGAGHGARRGDRARRALRRGRADDAGAPASALAGERAGSWAATPLPGPKADAYGCGDAFAAALTYGLGAGMMLSEAIELAARCGAAVLCGRGPYGAMLELSG